MTPTTTPAVAHAVERRRTISALQSVEQKARAVAQGAATVKLVPVLRGGW